MFYRVVLLLVFMTFSANATPPENANPEFHDWFARQNIPHTTISCCSVADGRAVTYRIAGDHYEAYLTKKDFPWIEKEGWTPVDPRSILQGQDNPTGRAIAWVSKNEQYLTNRVIHVGDIMCFILPPQA